MGADASSSCVGLFARFHPRTVVVAHEMQQCVHERAAPGVADDVGFRGGSIDDLDVDHAHHLRRCVPVSSACSLYASTIRWTSLCRTTSSCPKRMNAMPSIEPRMSCT